MAAINIPAMRTIARITLPISKNPPSSFPYASFFFPNIISNKFFQVRMAGLEPAVILQHREHLRTSVYSCTWPSAVRDTVIPHCQISHIPHLPVRRGGFTTSPTHAYKSHPHCVRISTCYPQISAIVLGPVGFPHSLSQCALFREGSAHCGCLFLLSDPGGTRTRDPLINLPLRLSPPKPLKNAPRTPILLC